MFGKVCTSALLGIDAKEVIVEADYGSGLPSFDMVGFLSSEVREARERVKAALKNSGIQVPPGKLTINLSPADLRKQGNYFDLPIAIAILIALGYIPQENTEKYLFVGELSLDGNLREIHGTLSHVICARELKKKACVLPIENGREGEVFSDIEICGFSTLSQVVDFLLGNRQPLDYPRREEDLETVQSPLDFSEICGQESVKRAIEVAAAGRHGILMIGPPGSGKTLTAKRIPTILPPMTLEERIETTKVYSVFGLLEKREGLISKRPFRSPHHTISANALVGGGSIPKPGEMSLAHNGVLFLDELPEFSKLTLEVMREPLEEKSVSISRVHGNYTFPTNVMLACAMNPCRCGYYPDRNKCHCSVPEVKKYLSKISKPLLDRIDISVEVPRLELKELQEKGRREGSKEIRERISKAWEIQWARYAGLSILFNSALDGKAVRKYCALGKNEQDLLKEVFDKMDLSARAHDRILKVARTIADLDGSENIGCAHLAEAISYRSLDQKFWGEVR